VAWRWATGWMIGVRVPAWAGREAEHSPPTSAVVKNAWSYTSILCDAQLNTGTILIFVFTFFFCLSL
jgi:hypothetical protein